MSRLLATGSVIAAALLGACALAGCQPDEPAAPLAQSARPPATRPVYGVAAVPLADEHLLNLHQLSPRILSGAQPDDEAGFRSLRDRGVKTIISVDGAKPDVEAARKYGMRYVHLPIGYDGVSDDEGKAIAKAIQELPGPIYVHCHHGKHRTAAAVAVACVMLGEIQPEQAEGVLREMGTGENYKGLWAAARAARPAKKGELEKLHVEFPEVAKITAMADAMVDIDHRFDNLKLAAKYGYRTPNGHPDIDPKHEALQLWEKLFELGRSAEATTRPGEFATLLAESEAGARELKDALASWAPASPQEAPPAAVDKAVKRVSASCVACHKTFRD
jgi:protein tyrosine phosphatase (PTP) superfamily phosphohydrolase (DUF442 family)